ncbi:MAG: hypothetical protein K8R77_16555, partial [Anaerolineaceae bacterium]|nr:hypothetical protein [Anaerolineaceae bacterium]
MNNILLKNTNIIDVENNSVNENMDIVIENDVIKDVSPSTENHSPDYETIDCSGKFALPGLFESHAHLCWLETFEKDDKISILKQFVEKGITQVRDVGGPFNILKKMKEEIHANNITGPEIF